MPRVCILTDTSAQFTDTNFPGHDQVYVIPFETLESAGRAGPARPGSMPFCSLTPPSARAFLKFYTELGHQYDAILTLVLSSTLGRGMQNAISASAQYNNHAAIRVVDTQTVAVGLGLLVEAAAKALEQGASLDETVHLVRAALPRLYMLICVPELTYLAEGGHLDRAQARVGELLGMLPIFVLEEGRLTPMEKVRTSRHLFESFQEFMGEFETPVHIALLRGACQESIRSRPLRQYVQESFPFAHFSEHAMTPTVEGLFGPRSIGLVIQDASDERSG